MSLLKFMKKHLLYLIISTVECYSTKAEAIKKVKVENTINQNFTIHKYFETSVKLILKMKHLK